MLDGSPEATGATGKTIHRTTAVKPGICGICPAGCGVNVHFRDGKIERLTPLKGHPLGIVCPRGARAAEIVYAKERILYPQRRVGERGAGRFERISWDDAYEIWVKNLRKIAKKFGPQAVCMYTGRGNFELGLNEAFMPSRASESSANAVLFPFGSPNTTGVGALCYVANGMMAPQTCFGTHYKDMRDDVDNADLVVIWGANPATDSSPVKLRHVKQAKKRGARIIVIDHRRNETARAVKAQWYAIRPGTDGALALGAIAVLIEENLYDRHFVEKWTHGFEELRDYVRDFTPQRVEQITGIPAAWVSDLARAMARAKGCSMVMYTGLEYSNSGVQSIRAALTLQALCGHLDVPGGKIFAMPKRPRTRCNPTKLPAGTPAPIGVDEFPLFNELRNECHAAALPRAILENDPYPVRSMIISGASIVTSWPNPDLWRRALASLDFLTVINRFPTADAAYADLILPATTGFEIESYMIHDGYAQHRARLIEPLGEARNDYLIFAELAQRLGYKNLWPLTEEGMVRDALSGLGISLEELRNHPRGIQFQTPAKKYHKIESGALRADGQPGLETPTGKFEIASQLLKKHGYDPLPVYTEPSEGPLADPELAKRYPLVFNSGARTQAAFRSQHFNIPTLISMQPRPHVHLHSHDAAQRGICEGDEVFVISPRGRVRFWAQVDDDIAPGVVEANMGGGGPLGPKAWRQANVNVLTDMENRDPISGFPVYKALLCDVLKSC
ncbi:MAG: molybdopterin-containing oxidoreductase family protein [Alphaproteobacteria bacterium]